MAHISRRISNEKKKWDNRDNEIYTLITDESKLKVEVIIFEIGRYNHLIFDFIIPFEYPFTPPTVLLKGVPLKRYYFTSRLFREELKSIKNTDNQRLSTNTRVLIDNQRLSTNCLCCASILCQNNWGPTLNIINIVDEITEFFSIKLKIVERFMVSKVMKGMPEVLSKYVLEYI
jgi:ubiquitin-protein ligase